MKLSKLYTVRSLQGASCVASVVVVFVIGITSFLGLGGMKVMHVVSDSMVPAFATGDVLIVSTLDKEQVQEGDIVAYTAEWLENKTVTHRVKNVNGDKVITRGDANGAADPEFTKDKIVGKISAIIPKMGEVFSPSGVLGLSACSIGLLAAGEALEKKWKREDESHDDNNDTPDDDNDESLDDADGPIDELDEISDSVPRHGMNVAARSPRHGVESFCPDHIDGLRTLASHDALASQTVVDEVPASRPRRALVD